MNIRFLVELDVIANADQDELKQEIEIALESSFLVDKGVEKIEVTQEKVL